MSTRSPAARLAVAAAAVPVLALLAAACSDGSSGGPGVQSVGSSRGLAASAPSALGSSASSVAYSACIRSHGVPNYPDPASNGNLPKGTAQDFGVSTSRYQAAERACGRLLPNSDTFNASLTQCLMNGDGDCPPALVHQALTAGRTFAQCMRHDGVPNWPDPTVDSIGRPSFQTTAAGISMDATRSPQMLAKIGHCQTQPGTELLREE